MKRLALMICSIGLVLAGGLQATGDDSPDAGIQLIVEEPVGFDREDEPVTLGVPFSPGELGQADPVRVLDPGGGPVSAQFKPMAFWPDGSVKWLKCDFFASVGASSTARYELEVGTSHTPATPLAVEEDSGSITVTTGPLRFVVSKAGFTLFERVRLDLDGNGEFRADEEIVSPGSSESGPVLEQAGATFPASDNSPIEIEIEERGPVKVVIRVTGVHGDPATPRLKFETRITAHAGSAAVRISHVYANGTSAWDNWPGDVMDPARRASVDAYDLGLRLNLSGQKSTLFGGDDGTPIERTLGSGGELELVQRDRATTNVPFEYDVLENGSRVDGGSRAEGYAVLSDSRWGVLVTTRYFWQKYPKGLHLRDDGTVLVRLLPEAESLLPGMGTRDDVLVRFHAAADAASMPDFAMGTGAEPLLPRASAERYAETGVFYALEPGASELFPGMDAYIDEVTANHLQNRETLQLYGNLNFGDVPRDEWATAPNPDLTDWGNNYYDCVLTAARLFAKSGDRRFVDVMVPMAWHFLETDCWNTYDANDWLSGFAPTYGAYHRETVHFEHHYGEGIWYYHYLTGDERAREIGLRAADSIVDRQVWANENFGCRTVYQRGAACLEAFKATRDPKYLTHARKLVVDGILATQDEYGLIGGVSAEAGTVTEEQSWMMALYSDTLWKFLKESPDPDLAAKLVLLADFLDQHARKEPGREEYWNAFRIPGQGKPQPITDESEPTVYWSGRCLIAGTYAYAFDLTGDEKYRTLARNALANLWGPTSDPFGHEFWGKASCQVMKNMPHAAAIARGEEGDLAPELTAEWRSVKLKRKGKKLDARLACRNAGSAGSSPFSVKVYLSATQTVEAESILLVERELDGLGIGEETEPLRARHKGRESHTGMYLLAEIVADGETTLVVHALPPVKADLAASWGKVAVKKHGTRIVARLICANEGGENSGRFKVEIHVSDTPEPGVGSTTVKVLSVRKLRGLTKGKKIRMKIRVDQPVEGKYLVAVLDPEDTVDEADEEDNTAAILLP